MRISIIVPIYNQKKYIRRCVQSIEKCFREDYECILVDDGSTDDSGRLCDILQQNNNAIKVIHIPNGGVSKARNVGIELSRGEYITFVDSDDYVKNIDINFLNNKDLYILEMGRYLNGKEIFNKHCLHTEIEKDFVDYPELMNSVCNKFFKRKIIIDNNIRFNTEYSYSEDLLFVTQYLTKIKSYEFVRASYYMYVVNSESASHYYTLDKLNSNIAACNETIRYIKNAKVFANGDYLISYLNMNNWIQYLINPNTYNPEKYRSLNRHKNVWHYKGRWDLALITGCANIHIDFVAAMYTFIKKRRGL